MLYSKELLIELVKINMQEGFSSIDATMEQVSGPRIGSYIEQKLPEAIMQVFCDAPVYLLEQCDASSILTPNKNQNGSGEVILPDDILRLTLFKMKGWERAVTRFYPADSPTAELQTNIYTMAGRAKPVAVLSLSHAGERVLKYYSLPPEVQNHEIEDALYVKFPDISKPIEINELLLPSITYMTAAMVFDIMGEVERAAIMRANITIKQ